MKCLCYVPVKQRVVFLAFRIRESLDLPMHGKPHPSTMCMKDVLVTLGSNAA